MKMGYFILVEYYLLIKFVIVNAESPTSTFLLHEKGQNKGLIMDI